MRCGRGNMLNYEEKPIIAMLHMKGYGQRDKLDRMAREAETCYKGGVDAVLVENYFGDSKDCELGLRWLAANFPDRPYGVNILGDYRLAFALAREYGAQFVQIDSVCGHLAPDEDEKYARRLAEDAAGRTFDVLGGLRFKYQPILSGRTLQEDADLARLRCDAVVTTGAGTGFGTPTEKLVEFREALGGFPLIVGAGVTADTVGEKLRHSDGAIVGSWLKEGHAADGDVSEAYVHEFMGRVRAARRTAAGTIAAPTSEVRNHGDDGSVESSY